MKRKRWEPSRLILDYMDSHPYCEACGNICDNLPHHIKTRGAGGWDEHANLLRLCVWCHGEIHSKGVKRYAQEHPELQTKILAAKYKVAAI